jgi:hypothetical protein
MKKIRREKNSWPKENMPIRNPQSLVKFCFLPDRNHMSHIKNCSLSLSRTLTLDSLPSRAWTTARRRQLILGVVRARHLVRLRRVIGRQLSLRSSSSSSSRMMLCDRIVHERLWRDGRVRRWRSGIRNWRDGGLRPELFGCGWMWLAIVVAGGRDFWAGLGL